MTMKKYLVFIVGLLIFLILLTVSAVAGSESALPILKLPLLEDLKVSLEKEVVQIDMKFSEEIEYNDSIIKNPTRFVIDVKGGWYLTQFKQEVFKDPLLHQVRYFHHRDGLRIVAELKYDGPGYSLSWNSNKKTLSMVIERCFTKKNTTNLAHGVKYHYITSGVEDGPINYYVLELKINPFVKGQKILEEIGSPYPVPEISLRTVFKKGGLRGFSTISDLVKQEGALAGINGGYFGPDGMPLGLIIQDGELVSAPIYDRTAWGIDNEGKMRIDRVSLEAEVAFNFFDRKRLSGINRPRYNDEFILYTPSYGRTTNTNQWGKEIVVQHNRVKEINDGNSVIPIDGFVISAHGTAREYLKNIKKGDLVHYFLNMKPDWLKDGVIQAVGGGPGLVRDGKVNITGEDEKFLPDILQGRAPRSALGITADNRLFIVAVDGRSGYSIGMTLQELADLMLSLGAVQAMNLDGGRSSTLVIRNKILNSPSSGEIPVHNGLVLKVGENFKK